ncbi:MAG: winged helix-turn-helix domain-containing protein [Pseudomonadales bacterium]
MIEGESFQLREWLVEPDLNQIKRDSQVVTLEPQTMAVLVMLAGQPGKVVPGEAIIEQVWGGRPMGDNPVYKAITKLRHALGDDARAPQYIETISKKGYRLIAPVGQEATPTADVVVASDGVPLRRQKRLVYSVAILAVAALLLWFTWLRPAPDALTLTKLVHLPGASYAPSFDPSGGRAVFVNERTEGSALWLLELSSSALTQIIDARYAPDRPAWRPNAETILFNSHGDIWSVDLSGAEPFVLIENASNAAWATSGESLVFERDHEVWQARSDGLGQRRISGIGGRQQMFAPREPRFSPDGKQLVYFDATQGPMGHIMLYDFDSGETRMILQDAQIAGAPVFSPDGSSILFHSSVSGHAALWEVAYNFNGKPRLLLQGTSDDRAPVPIPGAVVYTSSRDTFQLVSTDINSGKETVLYESRMAVAAPALSSDEAELAFFALTEGGGANIFVTNFAGQPPQQLTTGTDRHVMPKWSQDKEWIYHYRTTNDTYTYERVHVTSGVTERVFDTADFNRQHDITVDPTGRFALFALMERDKLLDTYVREIDSGMEFALGERLSWPDWAADGASFVATELSAGEFPVGSIVLCRLEDNSVTCDLLAQRGQHPVWSGDEDVVYFVEPVGSDIKLWSVDVATKQSQVLRTLGPTIEFGPFVDVTRDGKVLWVRYIAGQSELWLWRRD